MIYSKFEKLETNHLLLRKFRVDDVQDFFVRVGGNANVTKYMLWEPHQSIEDTKASIEKVLKRYEEGTCYTWAIALKEDDSVIGRIDLLRFDEEAGSCSFAYMIGDTYWGKGFGTEALSTVLSYAFEKMDMKEVIADYMSANVASGAVMRKVGMIYVTTLKKKYEKNNKLMDADEYRITRENWKRLITM